MTSAPTLATTVRAVVRAAGDPERAVQQQAYVKSEMTLRGLSSAQSAALLRPRLRLRLRDYRPGSPEEWEADVRALWDGAAFREERYAALVVARHRRASPWRTAATASTATC